MKIHYKAEIISAAIKRRETEKKNKEEEEKKAKEDLERWNRSDDTRRQEITNANIGWRQKAEPQRKTFVSNKTVDVAGGLKRNFERPLVTEEKKVEPSPVIASAPATGPTRKFFNAKKKQEQDAEGFTKINSQQKHS